MKTTAIWVKIQEVTALFVSRFEASIKDLFIFVYFVLTCEDSCGPETVFAWGSLDSVWTVQNNIKRQQWKISRETFKNYRS